MKKTNKATRKFSVGQLVISPDGMARIKAINNDGTCQIAIVGDEPRSGDIIVMKNDEGFTVVGDIYWFNPADHTYTMRILGDELPLGSQVFNLSQETRVRLQKRFGQIYAKQQETKGMSPADKELLASLGLSRDLADDGRDGVDDEDRRIFLY